MKPISINKHCILKRFYLQMLHCPGDFLISHACEFKIVGLHEGGDHEIIGCKASQAI